MRKLISLLLLVVIYKSVFGQVEKLWETKPVFEYPESVSYDSIRDVLYVSNYKKNIKNGQMYGDAFISKISKNGEIIEFKFIGNLTSPAGITIKYDRLYIVERFGIVEFDLSQNIVTNKYLIKSNHFLNDITIGADTSIYVSDSESNVIYRIKNGMVEKWLEDNAILNTNGILADGDKLIAGVNGDNYLKSIDMHTKEIKRIALMGKGIIDGIKKIGSRYLVSIYEGELKLVESTGEIIKLLNTREDDIYFADFEYIEKDKLIIVPALKNNKLFGYKLEYKF